MNDHAGDQNMNVAETIGGSRCKGAISNFIILQVQSYTVSSPYHLIHEVAFSAFI